MNWNLKIEQCEQAAARVIRNNGIDPMTGRSAQDIREYLLFSTPVTIQAAALAAVKRINAITGK